jgi:hypothetical protein
VSLEEAAALRAKLRLGATHGFFDDIGDFLSDVVGGVVDVVNLAVTAVGNAYEATVSFVEDSIRKFVDMTIEFAT